MALNDLLSIPSAAAGLTPASTTAAWGVPSWTVVSAAFPTDAYIIGVSFASTLVPALDTTIEILLEIGTGNSGAEVARIQIPYSFRMDTTVGYYLMAPYTIFLPEPFFVTQDTRVVLRMYDSHTAAVTYQGVKVFYREGTSVSRSFDPMGRMGFFGL